MLLLIGMNSGKILGIFISAAFFLAFAYGFYVLVICENHLLYHSFLGATCPKNNLVKYLTSWHQTFLWLLVEITVGIIFVKIKFLSRNTGFILFKELSFAKSNFKNYILVRPKLSLEKFKKRGKLHPKLFSLQ
ncbi:MAG: hypothetical protein ACK4NX_01745 [Candidatus Paceibacteria bacterium]